MSQSRASVAFATALFLLINFAKNSRAEVPSKEFLARKVICEVCQYNEVSLQAFIQDIGDGTWEADIADKGYIYRQSHYDQLSRMTHTQDLLFVPVDRNVMVSRMLQDDVELSPSARAWWVYQRVQEAQPDNSTKVEPNVTQNSAPDSTAPDNTLDKLDSMLAQTQPPTHRYNPPQGGAPKVGGALNGDITAQLTGEQRGAIGDQVRECWTKDARALEFEKLSVVLTVTLDQAGVARDAMVAPESQGRMGDPRFALFAARAVRAPLEARCADFSHLIPARDLGSIVRLKFMFRP